MRRVPRWLVAVVDRLVEWWLGGRVASSPATPGAAITVRVSSHGESLDEHTLRSLRPGQREWWLRDVSRDEFVRHVDLGCGDQPVDCDVRLRPGRYVLGVGGLRFRVHVPERET